MRGALYLDRLRTGDLHLPEPQLRRYRLRLSGGDVTREPRPAVSLNCRASTTAAATAGHTA